MARRKIGTLGEAMAAPEGKADFMARIRGKRKGKGGRKSKRGVPRRRG